MTLSPVMTGKWDGHSLWLQWSSAGEGTKYDLQIRFKKPGSADWREWQRSVQRRGSHADWAVIPVWKAQYEFQARVRVAGTEVWESAMEADFRACTAEFEITSTESNFIADAGTKFVAVVDGAVCTYVLPTQINVEKGESLSVAMSSIGASGYYQLDYPGHFEVKPLLGVTVRNMTPSYDDYTLTGRDVTSIEPTPFHEFTVAIKRPAQL